MHSKHVEN